MFTDETHLLILGHDDIDDVNIVSCMFNSSNLAGWHSV